MSCKYNNCKICGYKLECEIFKENEELKKSVNNWLKYEKETQYHKSIIKDLKKENAELKEALKGKVCKCMIYFNFKDLEKENAELKNKLEHRNCLDCSNHSSNLRMRTLELEKECTKAKELLRYYFDCFKNDNKYTLSDFEVVEDAEQFLNSEVEK